MPKMYSIFRIKSAQALLQESSSHGEGSLQRTLTPFKLIVLGIGIIVGAGIFSVTGTIAANHTGPAITLSFVIAACICGLTGLCYAELASRMPISGSAYTYTYATIGELPAWIVGWNIILEYMVGGTVVCVSWSQYFQNFLADCGIHIPPALAACPAEGGVINLPALLIAGLMSTFLIRGIQQSSWVNNIIVALKLIIIFLFIILGWRYIKAENLTPYIPANTGEFGSFGASGILRGAGIAFFAFLGFDSVSTLAQETRNPRRNMPIGILGSLVVVMIIYALFSYVLTGVANYREFQGADSIAPVSVAISHMPWPWLNKLIVLAILLGYSSVILVMQIAQSRIFMVMGQDGMLPKGFSSIHPRWRTPWKSSLFVTVAMALMAGLMSGRAAGELCSIGTLFAFTFVCAAVIVLRRRDRKSQASSATADASPEGSHPISPQDSGESASYFRVPWVPFIPLCSIAISLTLIVSLPIATWYRMAVWTILGLIIYFAYSKKHSRLNSSNN